MTLPLVLPPVVGGVALLLAFGRDGFIGGLLNSWFGLTIPFTPVAVVMAETFVAMPFLIVTVEGALRSADLGFEEAAATMGATKTTVFRRVTVPMIAPSLAPRRPCAGRRWCGSADDHRGRPPASVEQSPRNVWPARITVLTCSPTGSAWIVAGQPSALVDVTAAAVADLSLQPGSEVWLSVKATDLEVYPRKSD